MLADIVKIHCLTHRANFPMSRTSRIVVCKEGPVEHLLSNDFPYSGLWIYCCNCQTFIAWDTTRSDFSIQECPFCLSSINPRLYSCDHCSVTMLDFDDQTLRKHHTVLSWGMPQPACPGCHQFPGATPKIHFCHTLRCNLATSLPNCRFCQIVLDVVVPQNEAGNKEVTARFNRAISEAEARAREAEERRRLAEDAARKEIELRVKAEQRAHEIERKITNELTYPRSVAEARNITGSNSSNVEKSHIQAGSRDKVSIALYSAIAMLLFMCLIILVTIIVRLYL